MKPVKGWERGKPLHSKVSEKFFEAFKRKPLRQKVEESIYRLNTVRSKLEEFAGRLERKDKECLENVWELNP